MFKFIMLMLVSTVTLATEYVNINTGSVGVLDTEESATQYGIGYRFNSFSSWKLVPTIGIDFLSDNAQYVYTNIQHDFYLDNNWILIPSFGVGLYDNKHSIDLGTAIEFRSSLGVSYEFNNDIRLGMAVSHLSNGGISNTNPGTEAVVVTVGIPIRD